MCNRKRLRPSGSSPLTAACPVARNLAVQVLECGVVPCAMLGDGDYRLDNVAV
jgi:hypothetical protein